jgi:hypothetical protein
VSEWCGGLPCVGTGLQEQGDVAGGDDLGGHADDEADHSHAYGPNNMPELLLASVGAPGNAQ